MTYHPPPPPPQRPVSAPTRGSDTSWLLWAVLAVLVLAWPLALIAAMTIPQIKRHPARAGWLAVAGILAFLFCAKPLKTHVQTAKISITAARSQKSFGLVAKRAGGALPLIWLYTFPLGPAAAYAWREVRPKPLEEREEEKARLAQEKHERQVKKAMRQTAKLAKTDQTVLGIKIEGEAIHLFREAPDGRIWIETTGSVANLHMFLPGESGAGKTESLFRIMGAYAASTDWDIFYIDPKGERAVAERFYSLMRQSGRSCAVFPDQIYNGWQGSTNALVDRIMALAAFAEDGAAAYYTEASEVIIRAAVLAHGRPPQSFEELEERLRYASLLKAHKDDPVTLARIESAGEMNVASAHMRIANMTSKLSRIKAGGWTVDRLASGIWSVPVMGNKRDSAAISRFVLSDIEDYFSNRKDPSKRVVVVIDEFSSLGNDAVIRLMEVVRSLGGIIILAAQTVEGLGTPEQAARILGNVTTICHRMSDASAIIHRAGTARRLETSYQMQGQVKLKPTGQGNARMVEGDKVQLTDVQTLGVGAAWVIARGRAALIQVAPSSPLTMLPLPAREGEATAPPIKRSPPPGTEEVVPGVYRRPLPTLAPPPAPATKPAATDAPAVTVNPAGTNDPEAPAGAAPDLAPPTEPEKPITRQPGTTEEPPADEPEGGTHGDPAAGNTGTF